MVHTYTPTIVFLKEIYFADKYVDTTQIMYGVVTAVLRLSRAEFTGIGGLHQVLCSKPYLFAVVVAKRDKFLNVSFGECDADLS